jgi:hypothetical protein
VTAVLGVNPFIAPLVDGIGILLSLKFVASNNRALVTIFLVIILKLLSEVFEFAVALKVNEVVVSPETKFAVPVIAPVDEFKENPAPDKLEVVSE